MCAIMMLHGEIYALVIGNFGRLTSTYQSWDIADQVSFDITVTRIKFLLSTSKKNFTSFSYSKRFSTIINNVEPD